MHVLKTNQFPSQHNLSGHHSHAPSKIRYYWHYWDLHLIGTLTLTKIVIIYVKNGLKFDFGPASTNES